MVTVMAKKHQSKQHWFVIDAEGKILGRLATQVARILRGKHKAEFTPHVDTGDYVVVVNADKIRVTGKKREEKVYKNFSGYPSGLKEYNLETMLRRKPEEVVEHAVKGMLPKGKLGRKVFKKLKVYSGPEHPHRAQQCKELSL
jgi:large subunit ribosomal protein L13